jgi:hypothetical protein
MPIHKEQANKSLKNFIRVKRSRIKLSIDPYLSTKHRPIHASSSKKRLATD